MAHGHSGDIVVVLRLVELAEPPRLPPNGYRVHLAFLLFGADRARRKIRVWREVVELLTKTNAEDWLGAGPRTLSWCVRFLNRRSGGPLDWHRFWRSTLKLRKQDRDINSHKLKLAPVGKGWPS